MNAEPLILEGCRHDVLGHYLKAIGLLRVLALCAEGEYRDPEAEGWWDVGQACFVLRSEKYSTMEKLVGFFKTSYKPTPVMAAWNKEIGGTDTSAGNFCVISEREIALSYAGMVVSAVDRKKSPNTSKLNTGEAFAAYRDDDRHDLSETLDAIATPRFCRNNDNPVFLNKGIAGRAHIWRSYWEYLDIFAKKQKAKQKDAFHSLVASVFVTTYMTQAAKGKGTPFFPDAIKSYNMGSGWVQENYPFNALDYVLATEGALALRGSTARLIGANSRRFAAFPFIFDSGEDLINDGNEVKGTASALWLPLWNRPTTFTELSSFIGDAQARLPGKDARFSAEFVRALYAHGVDAGFSGWQEFRFKMKGSRVPWITTGRYVDAYGSGDERVRDTPGNVTLLNLALTPLDESRFLDQFDIVWSRNKVDSRSPHSERTKINEAMEMAALESTPNNCMMLLESIFHACHQMCVSQTFRKNLRGGRASFFAPLPMEEWDYLLNPLESQPEFRIARALASITGLLHQNNGNRSGVLPMLGSLQPLKIGRAGWFLPDSGERTHQDVWTGEDLAYDLTAVLRRRYLDSLNDDFPALRAVHGARLDDVLAFLRGELDDRLIARWTEAMSLIGWSFPKSQTSDVHHSPDKTNDEEVVTSIEPAYAALRTLLELELECEWQGEDRRQWKKRRSQQPFVLLCERSASSLPYAASEALRWISIWGVRNPWGAVARSEKSRISGQYVVRLDGNSSSAIYGQQLAHRLAAAVCIPLRWQDRQQLYRAVTLPPGA